MENVDQPNANESNQPPEPFHIPKRVRKPVKVKPKPAKLGPDELPLEPVARMAKDFLDAIKDLTDRETRYMVDAYYLIQEMRKRSSNQTSALLKTGEPNRVVLWYLSQTQVMEDQIKKALDKWTDDRRMGRWCKSICGIGPVITAGLLAHIDLKKMINPAAAGGIWRFAGLDPTDPWLPKTKRPWNAALKMLCWKIGESFVKVSSNDKDLYGHLWLARRDAEWALNLAGKLAKEAAKALELKDYDKKDSNAKQWYTGKISPADARVIMISGDTEKKIPASAPGTGVPMLPPAHIHARAKRYAVKLFLSHFHYHAYMLEYGTEPPKPYILQHPETGHTHEILPPPMVD